MMLKPKHIEGWMGAKGRRWLREQARASQRIIEVGVWKGRSTLVLARATRGTVWAVDQQRSAREALCR
jgi:predicted O-methyltransferase YrrM